MEENHCKKILIMDDEEMIRKVTTQMLKVIGYEVEAAANGEEAVELYRVSMEAEATFDAVIMDLTVPGGMGGRDAASEILSLDPDARCIVSSGYADGSVMSDYQEFGFKSVVPKPYTLKRLREVLDQVLKDL